jgi:phage shock protein C
MYSLKHDIWKERIKMEKRLYLSKKDKKIGGVCGGIAEYFNIDSTLVRLIFVLFLLAGGSGILMYIIAWIVIPEKPESEGREE